MSSSTIRFTSFPLTDPPHHFVHPVVEIFRSHEDEIGTVHLDKGFKSDEVLAFLRNDLVDLGFEVESGKKKSDKIERPVFYGEGGQPTLKYEVDAYHPEWRCGLEIEAARAVLGNSIYRDLIQALVMVQVDTLIIAVSNQYKYKSGGKVAVSNDYDQAIKVARTIYGHLRLQFPYRLVVIGY